MVKKIRNPETGRMVNVNGKIGQRVLSQYGGGKPLSSRSRDRENQQRAARELKQKKAQKGRNVTDKKKLPDGQIIKRNKVVLTNDGNK